MALSPGLSRGPSWAEHPCFLLQNFLLTDPLSVPHGTFPGKSKIPSTYNCIPTPTRPHFSQGWGWETPGTPIPVMPTWLNDVKVFFFLRILAAWKAIWGHTGQIWDRLCICQALCFIPPCLASVEQTEGKEGGGGETIPQGGMWEER